MSKLLVIGGGIMGQICAQAAVEVLEANTVAILERTAEHAAQLQDDLHIACFTSLPTPSSDYAIIVLAVKPQDAATAIVPLRALFPSALVISVMAGITTQRLVELTGSKRIVRCMPNTPAKVRHGLTGWTATPAVTTTDREFVQRWLKQFGQALWVESDDWIDKITAISGSGPGYVFAFAADLVDSAMALGFTADQARQLVLQTFSGAVELWRSSDATPETLRTQVTSPGGTTAAALDVLTAANMKHIWQTAVTAAYARAKTLQS